MSCEQWLILAEIDECAENSSGCSHGCTNTNGSYICTCPVGYKLMRNQHTCMGEFACITCCLDTACTEPAYLLQTCLYNYAFWYFKCVKVQVNISFLQCNIWLDTKCAIHYCSNRNETLNMATMPRHADVDECSMDPGCTWQCNNTIGSYHCLCPVGFALSTNGRSCIGK